MKEMKIIRSITRRDTNAIRTYLHDINKYPLLSPDEEAALGHRIKQGDRAALDKLVNSNLRFVVSIAKQHPIPQGLELIDLINEGNIGLVKAAERFDETRGFKFVSYAVHWIRQAIMQACSDLGRMVRMPSNKLAEMHRIYEYIAEYEQKYGITPGNSEVAQALGFTEEHVQDLLCSPGKHSSLDAPLKEGEDGTMLDFLPNVHGDAADASMENESLKTDILEALKTLTSREREVLMCLYGIGRQESSFEEVSQRLGLSRERCRQIRERATRALRYGNSAHILQAYL